MRGEGERERERSEVWPWDPQEGEGDREPARPPASCMDKLGPDAGAPQQGPIRQGRPTPSLCFWSRAVRRADLPHNPPPSSGSGAPLGTCPVLGLGPAGAHLSFTSSFTPELAWRAWFIMSCTRDRAVSGLGGQHGRRGPLVLHQPPQAGEGRAQHQGCLPVLPCRAVCPSQDGCSPPSSSPQSSALPPRWLRTWLPSPCPPWPQAPPDARPGSWASAPEGGEHPAVRRGTFDPQPSHREPGRGWGSRTLGVGALSGPGPCSYRPCA